MSELQRRYWYSELVKFNDCPLNQEGITLACGIYFCFQTAVCLIAEEEVSMSQEKLKNAITGVIGAFTENPDAAKAVFRANTELVENLQCTGTIRDFAPYTIDEPKAIGGADTGPNPLELLCLAVGTCQEIMYGAYAAVMGIPLDECKVSVKGYLDFRGLLSMDPDTPSGFSKVQFETTIKSPADDEALKQLVATVESHCPVMDCLQRPIEVTGKVSINGTTM